MEQRIAVHTSNHCRCAYLFRDSGLPPPILGVGNCYRTTIKSPAQRIRSLPATPILFFICSPPNDDIFTLADRCWQHFEEHQTPGGFWNAQQHAPYLWHACISRTLYSDEHIAGAAPHRPCSHTHTKYCTLCSF